VSESEHLPGKSDTDLAIESFADKMNDIYPNLDREEFHNMISRCVQDAMPADDGEESDGEEA
jgi:hypothetical protein